MVDVAEAEKRKQRFKLRKLVRMLEKKRARHTELISVYIPAGYNIQGIIDQLATEAGTARNIKSATTRKNVTGALEKMLQHLRQYKRTPPHGLALFAGNVAEREGQQKFEVWSLEPPEDIRVKLYQCEQEQLEVKAVYGLLVMDRREANLALLKGKQIVPVVNLDSMVPGKFKVGGQSAARMARVIEGMAKDFYKKVGDIVNEKFSAAEIKGIIVGGPGPTKEDFVNGDFLRTDVKKKILGTKNIGYTGEFGLKELVDRSEDILEKEEVMREAQLVQRFLTLLATRKTMVAYGEEAVRKVADTRAVEVLLISEDYPEDKAEELIDKVEEAGGEAYIISKETREGQQLAGLGGVAAILRYAA
ncbi:MAG: peptide chain release factor aRF-1 [Candidatus Nanoarchaeia archaeon]